MEAEHNPNAKPGERGYLGPGWDKTRPYGKPEGLADRLLDHIHKLGTDKTLPWVGLGLIDDLRAASEAISGKPAPVEKPKPGMEFDL